ncbi:uncharacterized protein LOC124708611 [Lolium rigidum]|uniref:uncharacterized protein LOC124708611 n=1 Tax=Lolium rigidum TaxID=89674 RepID=UPI001F5D62E6|nr:uncharacterized protein LOC124708611 [Lolium rigidum]
MDRRRAAKPPASQSADDDSELGVFTAERYFNDALAGEDALWCDRSSSSYSSAFKTWQHDDSALAPTAATSSSEASWNSRSAFLSNHPASAAAPAIEEKANSTTESEPTGGKARPSSSHLRRWILDMAGCACGSSDNKESMSADDQYREEMDAGSVDGGNKHGSEADATIPGGTSKQTTVEDGTTVRMMSGSCKWVQDGGGPPPLLVAEPAHRRAANPGELTMRVLDSTANASYDERRRVSATQSSAYTIVAGRTARGGAVSAAAGGSGSPNRAHMRVDSVVDDAAAPTEVDDMYPPSEASIVWSVVTAEGAASGNFSSAASGRYYYFNDGDEDAGGKSHRRRRNNGGGLLTGCMSKRAVDTVGQPRTWSEVEPAPVARVRGPDMARRR